MIRIRTEKTNELVRLGKDIWQTKEEAIANAEEKREKKIKQLEKQIEKLKAIDFTQIRGIEE